MGKKLADGDRPLALLRELGPVRGHARVVIQPAAGMGKGQRHGSQPLGGGVDEHHRVLFPGVPRLFVADPAPEIDDLFAVQIRRTGAAQLSTPGEVFGKGVAHGLEAADDVSFYTV
jgi:hypothetical protein